MLTDALLATLHHLLMFLLIALLATELVLLRPEISAATLMRLTRIDGAYGAVAGLLLLAGGARLMWGVKSAAFYAGNGWFWAKMALFAAIGLISILPTLRFIRWSRMRKADAAWLPDAAAILSTRRLVVLQIALFTLIPFSAALMARGFG